MTTPATIDPRGRSPLGPAAAPRARRVAVRAIATLVLLPMLAFGGQLLLTGWFDPAHGGTDHVGQLSWGVAEGLLLAAPAAWLVFRPLRSIAAVRQLGAAVAAQLVAMLVVGTADPFPILLAVLVVSMVAVHPRRREVLRLGRPDALLAVIVVLGAIPLLGWGWHQLVHQQSLPATDPHVELLHYAGAGIAALALVLVGAVSTFRAAASRLPAVTCGVGVATLSIGSLLFPQAVAAWSLPWAMVGLLGGVLFIAATEWRGSARTW